MEHRDLVPPSPSGKNEVSRPNADSVLKCWFIQEIYMNHCVRSTVCGLLDRGKFGAHKIMRWSGHKSENSIKSHAHTTTNAEKKEMADYLNNAAVGQENILPENKPEKVTQPVPKAVAVQDPNAQNMDEVADISICDLLELTPEQEQSLLKDLFDTEMEIPDSVPNNVPGKNAVVQNVKNIAQPVTGVTPKMLFSHSSVTINLNINK